MATLTTMLQSAATRLTACAVPGAAAKRRRPGLSLPFMLLGSGLYHVALLVPGRQRLPRPRQPGVIVISQLPKASTSTFL